MEKDDRELLPDKICLKCAKALRKAVDLRNLCIDTDNILQNELKLLVWHSPMMHQNPTEIFKSDRLSPVVKNPFDDDFDTSQIYISNLPNPLEDSDRKNVLLTPTVMLTTYSKKQNVKRQEFGFHSEFTVCDVCGKNIKRNYIKDHIKTHDTAETKFHCEFLNLLFMAIS